MTTPHQPSPSGTRLLPAWDAVERAVDAVVEPVGSGDGPVVPGPQARTVLRPTRVDAVRLDGAGLLGTWQRRNAEATLPHCIDEMETSGALPNLRRPPGDAGAHAGMWFSDSDVYKTLEAMAWQLASRSDPELLAQFDAIVAVLEAAQEPDGYLNSYFQHADPARRWHELATSHELYCAGHLIQAAVAAHRAGVGTRLLRIARRFADLIVARFGASGQTGVCGHPEIETALVELYRVTGYPPYLETARRFVELRGHGLLGPGQFGPAYFQDHAPVRDATEFIGHAVRQVYLLAGVVDVAVETGDDELLAAAERLWRSAYDTRTYITGAQGSRHRDEAIGDAYELPADRAYAETCAAIGSFQWNWRMLLATGEARYAEEMERALYNAIAVAVSQDGRHFFYSNPLHLRTGHTGGEDAPSQRLSWYACACCPPNLARLLGSLPAYLVTTDASGVQLHQYTRSHIDDGTRSIHVDTEYPWDGTITLTVTSADSAGKSTSSVTSADSAGKSTSSVTSADSAGKSTSSVASVDETQWTLALRVPAWCHSYTLHIDGVATDLAPVGGYLRLTRTWTGQTVTLRLAMPPRLVAAHPRVDAVRGCVCLTRGPVVYAIEQADLPPGTAIEDVALDLAHPIGVHRLDPASPIPLSLTARGQATDASSIPLYRTITPADSAAQSASSVTPADSAAQGASFVGVDGAGAPPTPIALTAVPYFLWGNRRPGPMRVWIPAAVPSGPPLRDGDAT